MSVEEDIINVIQRKVWTVEDILPQAKELAGNANKLPDEARKGFPSFSGDWSEENVKKYLQKLHAAVRDPLRYRNRKHLEDIGVQTKGVPEVIFDDSLGVKDIVGLFDELKEFSESVTDILIKKQILSAWLREGMDRAKQKLKGILDAKPAFQRILNSTINENLRFELVLRSAENTGFIGSAEDIISKAKFISEFEISVEYTENFEEFINALTSVYDKLTKLQEDYGIQNGELSESSKGKTLQEAYEVLNKKLEDYSLKKSKFLEEWKMYSNTLRSIGCTAPEAPLGLHELEEEIEKLKSECLKRLGEEGLRVLRFLKGEEDFPEEISKDGIKKALEVLRPLFAKFLREES